MTRKFLLAAATAALLPAAAQAGAIIDNGLIQMGVNDLGNLNFGTADASPSGVTTVGLRYLAAPFSNYESTAQGCECEGWGVADAGSGLTGYANDAIGTAGLSLDSFTVAGAGADGDSTGASAISIASLSAGSQALSVTHSFAPTSSINLYGVTVTITNTGTDAITDLRYRRTFDWDVDNTPFDEYVTIGGTAGASAVIGAVNNGFCDSNALTSCDPLLAGGSGDFTDLGPSDHGANFDFAFRYASGR